MTTDDTRELWPIWQAALRRADVAAALQDIYGRLAARIAERAPTCALSGRCCNFEAYGHRLYVTGVELAWVVERAAAAQIKFEAPAPSGLCPFQVGKLCRAHAMRPLGCRVFFCQEGTQAWQQELHEGFLGELRALHDRFDLPYRYMEWRRALAAVVGSD
jgi:Fe-S-cluster containining protein